MQLEGGQQPLPSNSTSFRRQPVTCDHLEPVLAQPTDPADSARAAIEPQEVRLPAIDRADEALGRPNQRHRGQPSAVSGNLPQRFFVDP